RGRPDDPRRPVSRVDTPSQYQIFIDVPGLVSGDLFGVVQAQLEENRQRRRDRPGGGRYLLQGLVVCKRCGYGCYGKPTSRGSAKGQGRVPYAYYRCTGSGGHPPGAAPPCLAERAAHRIMEAGRVVEGRTCVDSYPSRSGSGRSTSGGFKVHWPVRIGSWSISAS